MLPKPKPKPKPGPVLNPNANPNANPKQQQCKANPNPSCHPNESSPGLSSKLISAYHVVSINNVLPNLNSYPVPSLILTTGQDIKDQLVRSLVDQFSGNAKSTVRAGSTDAFLEVTHKVSVGNSCQRNGCLGVGLLENGCHGGWMPGGWVNGCHGDGELVPWGMARGMTMGMATCSHRAIAHGMVCLQGHASLNPAWSCGMPPALLPVVAFTARQSHSGPLSSKSAVLLPQCPMVTPQCTMVTSQLPMVTPQCPMVTSQCPMVTPRLCAGGFWDSNERGSNQLQRALLPCSRHGPARCGVSVPRCGQPPCLLEHSPRGSLCYCGRGSRPAAASPCLANSQAVPVPLRSSWQGGHVSCMDALPWGLG